MNKILRKALRFLRSETVLCIALFLAAASAFVVPPDEGYVSYIDFRTLAILFVLMGIMAGMRRIGIFQWIAQALLGRVKKVWQLVLILVMLCFFLSMLITNDVALITFVPFTFVVLGLLGDEMRGALVVPVVVMQTIAANLGSMFTPIGNPQNLYLYGRSGMSLGAFLRLMLPYTLLSFLLLLVWCILLGKKNDGSVITVSFAQPAGLMGKKYQLVVYLALFALSLLTVAKAVPYGVTLAIVLAWLLLMDRHVLARIDYCLLLTFVGFFIFIGNMGQVPVFHDFLQRVVEGNETLTAVLASQIISNVPAALLLSGFTDNLPALIVGVNLGGLGTLIASMASLISYKYIAREEKDKKRAYLGAFTLANIVFLAALGLLAALV